MLTCRQVSGRWKVWWTAFVVSPIEAPPPVAHACHMATYSVEGQYAYGKWTWKALKRPEGEPPVTLGVYSDIGMAQAKVVSLIEADARVSTIDERNH